MIKITMNDSKTTWQVKRQGIADMMFSWLFKSVQQAPGGSFCRKIELMGYEVYGFPSKWKTPTSARPKESAHTQWHPLIHLFAFAEFLLNAKFLQKNSIRNRNRK